MIIGVDFDNTIVCYDEMFHKTAVEMGAAPADLEPSKEAVRNYLRECDQEHIWTEMQGYVYGVKIRESAPFSGVIDFFRVAVAKGVDIFQKIKLQCISS